MRKLIATLALGAAGIGALGACHSTNPITVCSETKPLSTVSLRSATSSGGVAVCDGVTTTRHYYWHIRYSDHVRTYYQNVPR